MSLKHRKAGPAAQGKERQRACLIPRAMLQCRQRIKGNTGQPSRLTQGVRILIQIFISSCRSLLVYRSSSSSLPPPSYRRKRARLSVPSDSFNPSSRPGSVQESPDAKTTGSLSSRRSGKSTAETLRRATSSSAHAHVRNDLVIRPHSHIGSPSNTPYQYQIAVPSRPSLSQMSLPISALISPHAPSVTYSGKFHMHDPRKPAPIQSTPWSLSFPSRVESGQSRWEGTSWAERGGSPLCAWLFFIGFVIFPVWWVTWFIGVPQTRRLVDDAAEMGISGREKAVVLDDPQLEYGKSICDSCRW